MSLRVRAPEAAARLDLLTDHPPHHPDARDAEEREHEVSRDDPERDDPMAQVHVLVLELGEADARPEQDDVGDEHRREDAHFL